MRDNTFVALPAAFVALTVKFEVTCAVGVPVILPSVESISPAGKLPLAKSHVIGVEPVADSVVLYVVFTLPLGSEVVVIVGRVLTIILNALVALPAMLVAFTVKLDVPAAVGVPEMSPAPERLKPLGKLPLSNDHVIGAVPVASN